jgi:hypothetical protein
VDEYGTIRREQEWLSIITTRLQLLEDHVRRLEDVGVDYAMEWGTTATLLDNVAEFKTEIDLLRPLRDHLERRIARLRQEEVD